MLTPEHRRRTTHGASARSTPTPTSSCAARQAMTGRRCRAALFSTDAATFRDSEALQAEVFGASSLVVRCTDAAEMASVAAHLEGQLTATLHADESDHDAGRRAARRCWN